MSVGTHTIQLKAQVGDKGEFKNFGVVQQITATQAPDPNKGVKVETTAAPLLRELTEATLQEFKGGKFTLYDENYTIKKTGTITASTTISSLSDASVAHGVIVLALS